MKQLFTPKMMYEYDSYFVNQLRIPSAILMENAAHSSANYIKKLLPFGSQILIVCGSGNNGGDGFAIARHLIEFYDIHCVWIGSKDTMSDATFKNFDILSKLELLNKFDLLIEYIENNKDLENLIIDTDCVIDSLLGIGGSEKLKGIVVPLLSKLNNLSALKIAIDSPSGLNSLNGNSDINAFKSDYTITMFAEKCGHYINDGPELTGKIKIASLGVPETGELLLSPIFRLEENNKLFSHFKNEIKNTSKFDFGRVVIIAGSEQYPGAGTLTANASIKSGAGFVHLISTEFNSNLLPEIIPHKIKLDKYIDNENELEGGLNSKITESSKTEIFELIEKSNLIVFGPGIGTKNDLSDIYEFLIEKNKDKIIIIDADGLRYIKAKSNLGHNVLLTPHIGEYSKLINQSIDKINENRIESVMKTAKKFKTNILLKGVGTLISNGKDLFINTSGNSALSTAGSGDVLSGILATNLSKIDIKKLLLYSALSTFIHGKTAEIYTKKFNSLTMTASDIIDYIKYVIPPNSD